MTVSQFIRVNLPPARPYVARAVMPFPTGTNVNEIGNEFGAVQQHRLVGQTHLWDLYEWMVKVPAGTTQVLIGDDFVLPQSGFPVKGGTLGFTGTNIYIPPNVPTFDVPVLDPVLAQTQAKLLDPTSFQLELHAEATADFGSYTEIVSIAGLDGTPIRSGPLRQTWMKHVRTQRFGSFHVFWDVTANDPTLRLTLNWHTGVPAPEVLCKWIKVRKPNGISWIAELNDCAIDAPNGYLLRPSTSNHFMPRMSQRSFRVLFYITALGAPTTTQDPGWGMADWSAGGFCAPDFKLHSLSFAANLVDVVLADSVRENANLGTNTNNWDGTSCPSSGHVLWPTYGQGYGGPTGSDSKYKPYNGVKTAAANRREGLIAHKVLQLRNHSRDFGAAIYEEDGAAVVPEQHLNLSGLAEWRHYIGNGAVFEEDDPLNSVTDPYGLWKDAGFEFDAFRTRRLPRQGPELQTSTGGVLGNSVRWDCWDMQHRLLACQDDIALCYLDADPLAHLYLTMFAEVARMTFWTGPGSANRVNIPTTPAIGVQWGRDVMWSSFIVATAAVFQTAVSADFDDDNGELLPTARRARWRDSLLKVFVQGTEKAMMPNGCAWISGGSGKVFSDPPFNSLYWNNQVFEICYGMNAIAACYGVFGNVWPSALVSGDQVDVLEMLAKFARCLDLMHWAIATPATGFGIDVAGTGYSVNDVVNVLSDHYRLGGGTPAAPWVEVQARVTTIGGAGEVTGLAVQTAGLTFNQPGTPAKTYALVHTPVIAAGGTGYQVGHELSPAGGVPISSSQNHRARFRVNAVGAGGVITQLTQVTPGRYITPPASPGALVYLQGTSGAGTGATATWTRNAGGSGLRVTPTWGAPVETGSSPVKMVPFGPYPGNVRYTTRADFSPIDLPCRTSLKGEVWINPSGGLAHQIVNPGSGYAVGNVVTLVGGSRNHVALVAATFRVDAVDGLGGVTALHALTNGAYTLVPENPTQVVGGAGAGLEIDVVYTVGSGQQTNVNSSTTATIGLVGLAGAAEAVALLLQFTNTATVALAIQSIKNRGLPGGASGAEQIENYYPILAAYDT